MECAVYDCFLVHRDTKDVDLTSDESSGKEVLEKFYDSLLKSKKVGANFSTVIGCVKCTYLTQLIRHIITLYNYYEQIAEE